jgi:hypothetical protein
MSEHDFQIEMLNQLRDLSVGQSAIATDMAAVKEHLVRLNGSVARHEERIGQMQIELAERRNQCPLVDMLEVRIRPLEDHVVAERESEKTTSSWMKHMWPFIWVASGAFGLLILLHATDLLKFKP